MRWLREKEHFANVMDDKHAIEQSCQDESCSAALGEWNTSCLYLPMVIMTLLSGEAIWGLDPLNHKKLVECLFLCLFVSILQPSTQNALLIFTNYFFLYSLKNQLSSSLEGHLLSTVPWPIAKTQAKIMQEIST